MRPIATFVRRSGAAAPSVTFSSPGGGGVSVALRTELLRLDATAYSRFE
jgi:hypothetical protein